MVTVEESVRSHHLPVPMIGLSDAEILAALLLWQNVLRFVAQQIRPIDVVMEHVRCHLSCVGIPILSE